jgi:hypothetical protein
VGRNTAIRRFDAHPSGQPQDLFASAWGRAWIRRGSDLPFGDGAGRRAEVVVEVVWDGERGRPASFLYKGKCHVVDTLVQCWAIDRGWWDRARAVSRRCFRVLARGGVWDLAYDRAREEWLLVGVVD